MVLDEGKIKAKRQLWRIISTEHPDTREIPEAIQMVMAEDKGALLEYILYVHDERGDGCDTGWIDK